MASSKGTAHGGSTSHPAAPTYLRATERPAAPFQNPAPSGSEVESVSRIVKDLGADIQRDCRSELRAATRRMQQDLQKELRSMATDLLKLHVGGGNADPQDLFGDPHESFVISSIGRRKAGSSTSLRIAATAPTQATAAESLSRGQVGDLSLNTGPAKKSLRKPTRPPGLPGHESDSDGDVRKFLSDKIEKIVPEEPPPMLPMNNMETVDVECYLPGYCNGNHNVSAAPTTTSISAMPKPSMALSSSMADSSQADEAAGGPSKGPLSSKSLMVRKSTKLEGLQPSPSSGYLDIEAECERRMREDDKKKALTRLSITREVNRTKEKSAKHSKKPLLSMSPTELLHSQRFDNCVGALILLNAITIGLQTDYNARNTTDKVTAEFYVIDWIFCVCFSAELGLRLFVHRCSFFYCGRPGFLWNYFDTFVVIAQLLEIFADLVAQSTTVSTDQFKLLRVLRILRLVRILRVVRVLHLISELRTIVSSIIGSFKSLGWTVILLLLMIYIVAVYFTQAITDHLVVKKRENFRNMPEFEQNAAFSLSMTEKEQELRGYFNSLGRSILSLWQAMSGGMDWDTLAGPLLTEVSVESAALFAGYIAFALLALMNVVTGVFVQTALNSARLEEDAFMTSQIVALFNMVSARDSHATISYDEVTQSLEDPATEKEWKSIGVNAGEARYLFRLLDVDSSGRVPFEEFLAGCLRLNGTAKAIDLLTVMQEARRVNERTHLFQTTVESGLAQMCDALQSMQESLVKIDGKSFEMLNSSIASFMEALDENAQAVRSLKRFQQATQGDVSSIKARLETFHQLDALLAIDQPMIVPTEALNLV